MTVVSTTAWRRGNGWRQGCVLPDAAVTTLGLAHHFEPKQTCVIVISHDCDLAVDKPGVDDDVEVIVGRRLKSLDETLTRTKSPRRLHLPMRCAASDTVGLEIEATRKTTVKKSVLAAWQPAPGYHLDRKAWETLRTWLAIRYKRPAFPDEFDRRMDCADSAIAKIVARYTENVSALYYQVEPLSELDPAGADPYKVKAYVLYEAGDDIEKNAKAAEQAVKELEECFRSGQTSSREAQIRTGCEQSAFCADLGSPPAASAHQWPPPVQRWPENTMCR